MVQEMTPNSSTTTTCLDGLEIRTLESSEFTEWYINYRPSHTAPMDREPCRAIYERVAELLNENGARIFSERVFAPAHGTTALLANRRDILGDLDEGVSPTVLDVPVSSVDAPAYPQVQVHAVGGRATNPQPIEDDGALVGRLLESNGCRWLYLSGVTSTQETDPAKHARHALERATRVLDKQGMNLRCVARTWLWLRNILSWYDDFNAVRNDVFKREGLIGANSNSRYLPASTGIGVAQAGNGDCGLELIAVSDGRETIASSESAREQCSAFSYGSAFSRAVVAPMPAGEALFVSGTAAIDADGASEHPENERGQIDATLQHIRSLISDVGWSENQIVSGIAYCKTPEIARVFAEEWDSLAWPRVEVIGDVCRDELLFEMEVTAARVGPRRGASPQ